LSSRTEQRRRRKWRGAGLEPAVEGDDRRALPKGAVRPALVVVSAEGIELGLQVGDRDRRRLLCEKAVLSLVQPLTLPQVRGKALTLAVLLREE
jgi:hypothetical protein